jgi:DNA-binding transcriptional LysR family regulator
MNEIDLHQLRCLVVLAEELNFGRAAARLHLSQPPLTRLLAEVERIIGARLFERTTRRVRLTPIGETVVGEARAVLARAELAWENIRASVRREAGQLRLAYTPLALQTVLPRIIARIRERDHDVRIDLVELPTGLQEEALRSGHVDAGFSGEPLALEGFVDQLLHQESLHVIVPEGHALQRREAIDLSDLENETLILHARQEYPHYYDALRDACIASGFTPKIYHREARQSCLALVLSGQGVLIAPATPLHPSTSGLRYVALTTPEALRSEVWSVLPAPTGEASSSIEILCEVLGT